jgi:hypothetical protein
MRGLPKACVAVTAQIGELTRCLDLIRFKVGVYEDLLAQGSDDHCDR